MESQPNLSVLGQIQKRGYLQALLTPDTSLVTSNLTTPTSLETSNIKLQRASSALDGGSLQTRLIESSNPGSLQTQEAIASSVAASAPFIFNSQLPLSIPVGVATDANGNVFTTSDNVFNTLITKFAPNGTPLGQIPIGNITSIESIGKLALDPISGQILDLFPDGTLISINPDNGAITPLFNVRNLPINISNIYDIASGTIDSFGGLIQPQFSSFGDLAIFNGGNFLDLYISGISQAQVFPFVMRLRFTQGSLSDADVLVSSRASAAPNDSSPPGVAVNSQGVVLTTLPIPNATATGNFNTPVALPVNLDLEQLTGSFAPQVVLNGVDISSRGMTTDAAGNFYIATSAIGTTLGGVGGSGAIVILPPTLNGVIDVLTLGQGIFRSEDVAVSPSGDRLYVTVRSPGSAVVAFNLSPTQLPSVTSADFNTLNQVKAFQLSYNTEIPTALRGLSVSSEHFTLFPEKLPFSSNPDLAINHLEIDLGDFS